MSGWVQTTTIPRVAVRKFAKAHGLTLEVVEQSPEPNPRWTASFKGCEVLEGVILNSAYGAGPTKKDAIADYLPKISMKTLVFHAYREDRQEIAVPILTLYSQPGDNR